MGLFRSSSPRTSASENAATIALLRLKVASLEEQLHKKDHLIHHLQQDGSMDLSVSGKSISTISTVATTDSNSVMITNRLSEQLEEKNLELESIKFQLEEQRAVNAHLQTKLQSTQALNTSANSQIQHLQQALKDKDTQLECLQTLNETNAGIVSEMELHQPQIAAAAAGGRRHSFILPSPSGSGDNNQWKIYGKLQALMETNNQLSQQVSVLSLEKQLALQQVSKEQEKLAQLQKLHDASKSNAVADQEQQAQADALEKVLPEIQQVLDIFGRDVSSVTTETDPTLLQLALQVCLSQLKQSRRESQLQMTKTLKQSLALADAQATNDTLSAKLEHYEGLMTAVLRANKDKLQAILEMEDVRSTLNDTSMRSVSLNDTVGTTTCAPPITIQEDLPLDDAASPRSRRSSPSKTPSRSGSRSKRSVFGFFSSGSSSTPKKTSLTPTKKQPAMATPSPKTPVMMMDKRDLMDPTESMMDDMSMRSVSEQSIDVDDLFDVNDMTHEILGHASC